MSGTMLNLLGWVVATAVVFGVFYWLSRYE